MIGGTGAGTGGGGGGGGGGTGGGGGVPRRPPPAAPDEDRLITTSGFYQHLAEAAGFKSWDEAWDTLFEDPGSGLDHGALLKLDPTEEDPRARR